MDEKPYLIAVFSKDSDRIKEKLEKNGLAGELYYMIDSAPVQHTPSIMWIGEGEIQTGSPELLFSDPLLLRGRFYFTRTKIERECI